VYVLCVCVYAHAHTLHVGYSDVSPGVGTRHMESPEEIQMMMMIAFITIKSSLVPLIEGLCAQIYFRFEISVVCVHIFCFSFSEEKIC